MTTYTDPFGTGMPASACKLLTASLTTDTTFAWSYNSADGTPQIADTMEIITTAGLNLNFPAANQVSAGESVLIRNMGANQFTIKNAVGGTIATVAAGVAKLLYVSDNTSVAGVWSVLTFGTGTSAADATTLQGLGLLAIGATLNDSHPVVTTSTAYTVTAANRANTLVFTGGSVSCTLPTLAAAVNGFSVLVKNNGSGTITLVPQGAETIDQATLVPGESVMLVAGASGWVTVGYGRNVTFAFTRLNKNLAGLGASDVALSMSDVANKIINFYGTPAMQVNVVFPTIASVYYLSSSCSTYNVVAKTSTGNTVVIAPGTSVIVICDGVNISVATSNGYVSSVSLPDGLLGALSLRFTNTPTTGIYSPGGNILSVVTNGEERVRYDHYYSTFNCSLNVGQDPITGNWSPNALWVGYGNIQASYNGSIGISLQPGATVNSLYFDTTLDSAIYAKAGAWHSTGTSYGYIPAASAYGAAFNIDVNGLTSTTQGFADAGYYTASPVTGFSWTVRNGCTAVIATPADTLATGTITFPATPADGQELAITSTQTITALTLAGNGKTLNSPITTLAANAFARWKYVAANNAWYRVG